MHNYQLFCENMRLIHEKAQLKKQGGTGTRFPASTHIDKADWFFIPLLMNCYYHVISNQKYVVNMADFLMQNYVSVLRCGVAHQYLTCLNRKWLYVDL